MPALKTRHWHPMYETEKQIGRNDPECRDGVHTGFSGWSGLPTQRSGK